MSKDRPRIPPGQHETASFPVLDLGEAPNLSRRDWSLTVGGQVENPIRWDWETLLAQPQEELVSDIHCVTSWSRLDNRWTGVSVAHLLNMVRPRSQARYVMLRGFDGYATNVPLEHFAAPQSLLAHAWDGKPLEREHGGPVRAVIPSLYFWKSAKWLRHITFSDRDIAGYWELRGYHNLGDPWREQRFS